MIALADRAREQVDASNDPEIEHYLEWLPQVMQAFSNLSLAGPIGALTDQISAVTLERLRFCGIMLSSRRGEPQLVVEEVQHLREEIDELIKEIKESPIDEPVRQYALRHLLKLSEALREYELFGSERIVEELGAAIGSMFLHPNEARGAGEKFLAILLKVGSLVQAGAAGLYIAQVMKLLPGQ